MQPALPNDHFPAIEEANAKGATKSEITQSAKAKDKIKRSLGVVSIFLRHFRYVSMTIVLAEVPNITMNPLTEACKIAYGL